MLLHSTLREKPSRPMEMWCFPSRRDCGMKREVLTINIRKITLAAPAALVVLLGGHMWARKEPLVVCQRSPGESQSTKHMIVTWLILPVVIRSSQRLSHACVSINKFILWNCERLIISVIVYLIIPYYLDNRSNSRANTCIKPRLLEGMYLLD